MSARVVRLTAEHRRLLDGFENDSHELVVYLRRWALRHQERDRLGRTWLALDESESGTRLAGFFTLSAASVARQVVGDIGELGKLPRFPIPAILLARLAVDRRVQGQGIGSWLFDEALSMTLTLASDGPIGFRLLVTDAKDERAARFYERRGLVALGDEGWPRRMVLDLNPRLR